MNVKTIGFLTTTSLVTGGLQCGLVAADDKFDFPSSDSTVVASTGFINAEEVGYFWSVDRGDKVSETFTSGCSTGIGRVDLDIDVVKNNLDDGAFVDWDIKINATTVGSFTIDEGFIGPMRVNATFPSISGPTYDLSIVVTNNVPRLDGSHTLAYAGDFSHSVELICAQKSIEIDIQPGSERNPINLKSRGVIPVAVLTTSILAGDSVDFDAQLVDPSTVTFGPSEAGTAHPDGHLEDIDDDGDFDWVGHFRTQETGIACGDTEATLTGATYDRDEFEGTGSITVTGCAPGAGATKRGAISIDNL